MKKSLQKLVGYSALLVFFQLAAVTLAWAQPTLTFSPVNSATGVALNSNLTISFSEAIRKIDNSPLVDADLAGLLELKLTNDGGATVPFTATINGAKTLITIDPNPDLLSGTIYYLEINPIENGTDNAITATNITFTTIDNVPPAVTFNPLNAATGVVESSNITITFNEAVRKVGGGAIAAGDLLTLVELKLTNNAGAAVPFTASIDGTNKIITVDPAAVLDPGTVYYVEINPVEDLSSNATTASNITFTTGNTLPPSLTFNPANAATNVAVATNITITFNEAIRNIDDSPVVDGDLATLVELKLTNNGGAAVPFTATIDGTKKIVTIDPTSNLTAGTIYYVEMNPIEDGNNNAITATNVTFTTIDNTPPTITFNPLNAATNVSETGNITITFNEAVRKVGGGVITAGDLLTLVELKLTSNAGAAVPFTASINGANTIITIDPNTDLGGNTQYYVEINPVEDSNSNATTASNITFTTGDSQGPAATFLPANSATNVSATGIITITFNEAIRKTDDSPVTPADIQGGLIELRETNAAGAVVPFTATINASKTIVTLDPNSTLLPLQVYFVKTNVVEDVLNNASIAQTITFTTEDKPSITSFLPGATCIRDIVTITGTRFTGVAGPPAKPTVLVNGVAIHTDSIKTFSATSITFALPPGASTGPIAVRNNNSDLLSSNSATDLTVFPQINQLLPIFPETLSPAQNTDADVTFGAASPAGDRSQAGFQYNLKLVKAPAAYISAYTITLPKDVDNVVGNGTGGVMVNTAAGTTDFPFDFIGSYSYVVDVTRAGCTTRRLAYTGADTVRFTVASLNVNASATDAIVCVGETTTLIGSTSGGTGFYSFAWTSKPAGFTSTNSSPQVTPTVSTRYYLTLSDNSSNTAIDSIDITVNPVPTASFDPAPLESVVRTQYTIENRDYRLYGTPAGGVFSGKGVTLKNDNNYYFNPLDAGVGVWPIVYTFTNGFGCSKTDTETFTVSASAVDGLELSYCKTRTTDTGIRYNTTNFPAGFQFTRLVFYAYDYNAGTICLGESAPTFPYCGGPNPLTATSFQNVVDIQTGLTVSQPVNYTLDVNVVRNSYGYTSNHDFYILVYGKNAGGQETYRTYQYFTVLDDGPVPAVVGINEGQNICAASSPISLSASIAGYAVTNFSITTGPTGSLSGTNNKDFNPSHSSLTTDEALMTITMAYNDFNNCANTTAVNFNWVKKPAAPVAPDVEYCKITNGGPGKTYTINAVPNGPSTNPYWYELDPASNPTTPVLDSLNWTGFIAPGVTGLTPITKTFYVTQSYKNCEGATATVDIQIKDAPDATITRDAICEARDFVVRGPKDGSVPYTTYQWSFGDGVSLTIPGIDSAVHNYGPGSGSSPYTIGLTVTNSEGCTNTDTDAITVGLNPKPTLAFKFVCENDNTAFSATTDISVSQYRWDFGDGSPIKGPGAFQNTTHNYTDGVGTYKVKLTTYTAQGCFNSDSTNVTILTYLTATSALPYEMNAIDAGKGFWSLEDFRDSSTWEFAAPNKTMINNVSPAWVTSASGNYKSNDASALNSPCLDITGFQKPVISLDFISNTQQKFDGAVMEFSIDGGATWKALGAPNTGQNWFNTTGFFSGQIGSGQVGWSGDMAGTGNSWLEGKRALDDMVPLANRAKVRFRIAFNSNGDAEFEGFAFNNVSITERNRFLLMEHFTNEGDQQYAPNNTKFKALSSTEIVRLQYNLSFPGPDAVSLDNETDPNARAAYYGITNDALIIPRTYIDGHSEGSLAGTWAADYATLRALSTSPFKITITTSPSANPGEVKVSAKAVALTPVTGPKAIKPVIHIAVIEKTVGDNKYVLRKLLPDATGTEVQLPMAKDDEAVAGPFTWQVTSLDPADLAIVAFVQDEVTKDIYQAEFLENPPNLPSVVTGLNEDIAATIAVFPNPANGSMSVQLGEKARQRTPFKMFDAYGREVYVSALEKGEQVRVIDTKNLSGGVYLIHINVDGAAVLKKVMVAHD